MLLAAVTIFFAGCAPEAHLPRAKEGDILWQHVVGENIETTITIDENGNIYTTGGGYLWSFTSDGKLRWKRCPLDEGCKGLQQEYPYALGVASSPAVSPDGEKVYITGYAGVFAFGTSDGKLLWKKTVFDNYYEFAEKEFEEQVKIWEEIASKEYPKIFATTPAISADGSRLYAGCGENDFACDSFYCIDTQDGSVIWEYVMPHPPQQLEEGKYTRGYLGGASLGPDGTVYVASMHGWLVSLTDNGDSYTENWAYNVGAEMRMPPSMDAEGFLYVGSSSAGGYIHKVDSRTGKKAEGEWPVKTLASEVFANIAIASDGTIYANSEDYRLWAFNPDGTVKWNNLEFEHWGGDPLIRADDRIILTSQLNKAARVVCIRDDGDKGVIEWFSEPIATELAYNETSVNIGPNGDIYVASGVMDPQALLAIKGNGLGLSKTSPWPKYMGNIQNNGNAANKAENSKEDKAYNEFYKRVLADEPYIGFFAAEKKCIKKIGQAYKKARRQFFLGVSVSDEEVDGYMRRFVKFCKDKGHLNDGFEEEWEKTLTILSYVLYANKPIFDFSADNIIEHRDLVFAEYPNKKLELDLFLPTEPMAKPVPCVVCIHGGGWRVNRKIWFEPFAKYLASKGMAAVTIDYRMLPAVKNIDCVYDSKAAVRWVRANAGKYGIDPDRIGAIGASAGAHLVALLGTTADLPALEGSGGNAGVSSAVQAVVSFATPAFKIEGAGSAKAKRFGFTEEEIKRLSPYENISSSSAPLFLVHGKEDRVVNPQDSQDLYDKYKEVGVHVEIKWVPNQGHGFYEGTDFGIALAAEFFRKQFESIEDKGYDNDGCEKERENTSTILDVNYRELVSRADIHYDKQVRRSEEGLPIGNGVMGSLVWTTPKQLKLQINRVDVFAADSSTNSFPKVDSDYAHGCGFVDITFVDFGPDVFEADNTQQHLSVYDGAVGVKGNDVYAEVFAWPDGDVMVIRIMDYRQQPTSIRVTLRALRPVTYHQRNHYAFSRVGAKGERIMLRQQFAEGDDFTERWTLVPQPEASSIENRTFYCGSSVAISVLGRETQVNMLDDGAIQLAAEPGNGTFTILVSSAASFDIDEDINALALGELERAEALGYAKLKMSVTDWWHNFWSNSFVHLSSADGEAEYVEKHYTYFLYLMAASSQGAYPPRYGGMIWNTAGDTRTWGSMKWMYNLFCYYNNVLLTANKIDLTKPVVEMFHKNYDATALAARQQWGSKGIYLQETMWFNGPAELPEDIAAEMRDLYLVRKPWSEASERFLKYAGKKNAFDSRWCWKNFDDERWIDGHHFWEARESAPYSYVLHLFAPGAKIAYFHWLLYDFTQDEGWLREYGYPIIKGVAEFYRNYPNVKKGTDGKYHIHGVNNGESAWGSTDTIEELSAMYAVTTTAIRASQVLGVDEDMRGVWQEFLDNLAPLPTFTDTSREGEPRYWINTSHSSLARASTNRRSTTPCTYYDLFTLETTDPEMVEIARNSYRPSSRRSSGGQGVGWLSKASITAATMGDAEQVKALVPGQIRYQGLAEGYPDEAATRWGTYWRGPLGNRLSLAEGHQAMGAQRIGNAVEGLVLALCRATPAGPAGKTIIHVFPAWPKEWDAQYKLLARGNFLVTSSMRKAEVEFVEIHSQSGGECRLRNPWGDQVGVTVYRNGRKFKDMDGSLLTFETSKGENFVIVQKDSTPDQYKRIILGE